MKTIFKYRPLSEFLYKELYYNELYFASYKELNDPLDLSARIDFTPYESRSIEYLIWFLTKTHFVHSDLNSQKNNLSFYNFTRNIDLKTKFLNLIYANMQNHLKTNKNIWVTDLVQIIELSIKKINYKIEFKPQLIYEKLEHLTTRFLKSSYVSCFSRTNKEYLMWSHYASSHSGICLEFQVDESMMLTFKLTINEKSNEINFQKTINEYSQKIYTFKDKVIEVSYIDEQPYINFYEFAPVFENENDFDLIGLSKSWTHEYANKLKKAFSTKTNSWEYEKEMRAIQISFEEDKTPEERINHYPIEILKAIYFGVNTPENAKSRIFRIFENNAHVIEFYNAKLDGTKQIKFEKYGT